MNRLVGTGFILATEQMEPRLFDLDLQLLADATLMIIAVFSLFLIASKLLFNPVRDMLQRRQDKIKNELDAAAKDMEAAAALKADYEARLKNIDKEAEAILGEARKKGLANQDRMIAEAKEEAARIIQRAEAEAELERKKAAEDVKREMIVIASMMAGKVVRTSIDTAVQEALLDETLKEMGESTWLS